MRMRLLPLLIACLLTVTACAEGMDKAAPGRNFFLSAELDNAHAMQGYLADGVDPNARNSRGETPLTLAIKNESWHVLEVLVADPRTQLDQADDAGETPLMLAALKGRLDWVKTLSARGAKINRAGWTPLQYAASGPDNGVVAWLLAQGADINAQAPNGSTALMMAVRYAPAGTAELLLIKGANVRLQHQNGRNAADFARDAGREDLAAKIALAAAQH